MKAAATLFVLLASQVSALFTIAAEYSDNMIDIGDTNLFRAVWQRLYEQSNGQGGLSDRSYQSYTSQCAHTGSENDLNVQVVLEGQWGNVNGVSGWQMRDALVQAMWATIQATGNPTGYEVFTDCEGTTWWEGIVPSPWAACGGLSSRVCPCEIKSAQCMKGTWGHKVPSIVKIQVYDSDGSLRADEYRVTFSSVNTKLESGGCGRAGAIAEVLASFVPGVGSYFEKGIKIACRK